MDKKISIILLVLIIIALAFVFVGNRDNGEVVETDIVKPEQMIDRSGSDVLDQAPVGNQINSLGTFEDYSPEKVENAEGNIVLFFHASWCPTCRSLEDDINNNLSEIPSDLTILKVDFDKSDELKQKYGVRSQHTMVQVDNNGEAISAWGGGNRLSDIVSRVQ